MTSADILRAAAAKMRERAEDVALTDWHFTQSSEESFRGYDVWTHDGETHWTVATSDYAPVASHIASWHPVVALAVADWLDGVANLDRYDRADKNETLAALAVATAYLGTP